MEQIRRNLDKPLTYKTSGVDIEAGDQLVERIKQLSEKTQRPGCLGDIGGFGGLFELPIDRYQQPVLVSGADGVGTKLKFAFELDRHDTIGIDLVAMCTNDVVTCGAEPLFFLDYLATDKLDTLQAESVIKGISKGCKEAGAALIGGETAEMPGFYTKGEYDLAGFCVGIVEKRRLIDGNDIEQGDIILGLGSSGPHSNGYSLIRHVIERNKISLTEPLGPQTLGDVLLAPTRIYVAAIMSLLTTTEVSGIAHITGGGLTGNIHRILPPGLEVQIDRSSWDQPEIFEWLQQMGNISNIEMLQTFNCGLGLVLITKKHDVAIARQHLETAGEEVFIIGEVISGTRGVVIG